jgi:hypothetical protein
MLDPYEGQLNLAHILKANVESSTHIGSRA